MKYKVGDRIKPNTEPSKYPKLTPEELKAVKWLVEGGFTEIYYAYDQFIYVKDNLGKSLLPVFAEGFEWVKSEPINLAELLAAQEEKIT